MGIKTKGYSAPVNMARIYEGYLNPYASTHDDKYINRGDKIASSYLYTYDSVGDFVNSIKKQHGIPQDMKHIYDTILLKQELDDKLVLSQDHFDKLGKVISKIKEWDSDDTYTSLLATVKRYESETRKQLDTVKTEVMELKTPDGEAKRVTLEDFKKADGLTPVDSDHPMNKLLSQTQGTVFEEFKDIKVLENKETGEVFFKVRLADQNRNIFFDEAFIKEHIKDFVKEDSFENSIVRGGSHQPTPEKEATTQDLEADNDDEFEL